jgi:CheY-like chemotaxis protein
MNGALTYQQASGGGSQFTLEIPLAPVTLSTPVVDNSPEPALHILLVEDDPISREVTTMLLMARGHAVTAATTEAEAVTLATSQTFDLIFMDRQLGNGGCGLAATQQIRAAAVSAPIIGLSADGTASQITAAASAGMTGLIVKPIDLRHGLAAALDKARFPPASPKQAGA